VNKCAITEISDLASTQLAVTTTGKFHMSFKVNVIAAIRISYPDSSRATLENKKAFAAFLREEFHWPYCQDPNPVHYLYIERRTIFQTGYGVHTGQNTEW